MSFGFARGVPRNADLVFDMRFLDNPHWQDDLRPLTGLHAAVGEHIARDPAYGEALERNGGLSGYLLPRSAAVRKAYLTLAFGMTGGRHRRLLNAAPSGRKRSMKGFYHTVGHNDRGPGAE